MTNRESGKKLIKEAERIFTRDLKAAVEDEDYNMVVRRAQEVVEMAPSFYFERDYNEEDAQKAFEDADFLVKEIKRVFRF